MFKVRRALWVALVAAVALATLPALLPAPDGRERAAFYEELVRTYGAHHHSQFHEELLIRHFFRDRKGGVFVDVGASHYQVDSNTYFLESQLGWSGLAVDALEEYAKDYLQHRPRTSYVTAFVGDRPGQVQDFVVNRAEMRVSTGVASEQQPSAAGYEHRAVPTVTLNQLLERAGIPRVDLLSLDIEGAEPLALAGFDIDRYRPELVCVEMRDSTRADIEAYFAAHGYHVIEKYRLLDNVNEYFTARAEP